MAQYAYTFVSGDTVTPTKLNNARTVSNIVNADISNSAAIAGTKITPDFGSQNVFTSGRVFSGHNSAIETPQIGGSGVLTPRWQAVGTNATAASFGGFNYSSSGGSTGQLVFSKSLGGSVGVQGIVNNGNNLGGIGFNGSDGIEFRAAAEIRSEVDGTPTAGSVPGRIYFATTAAGDSTSTERMRITSAGNIGIGTTSPNAAAKLDVASTTRGFLPPRMTTAQRNAISTPPAGLMIYNTSTNKLNVRTASSWEAVTSA
jgi:hypothetical protein